MLLSALAAGPAAGQVIDERWSAPQRLSRPDGQAGEAAMAADLFGYVHAVWIQAGLSNSRGFVAYSRFDGRDWSQPLELADLKHADNHHRWTTAAVDQHGVLHVVWTSGIAGPTNYSRVGVGEALAKWNWSPVSDLNIAAYKVKLAIDAKGGLHLLYSQFYDDRPGVYYIHSSDGGYRWSVPIQLDPDIPKGHAPYFIHLGIDEADVLHAIWHYYIPTEVRGRSIHYARSTDGGASWSSPLTIAAPASDSDDDLIMANPALALSRGEVHVVWAGGGLPPYRVDRFSSDGGATWEEPRRILGDLRGQAISDGLATDSSGRIHFIGQIRWPQALYEAQWSDGVWSTPHAFYLIARDPEDPIAARLHAHRINLVVRSGNELVLTFTTSATKNDVLYAMQRTLDDSDELPALPIPAPPVPEGRWTTWVLACLFILFIVGVVQQLGAVGGSRIRP